MGCIGDKESGEQMMEHQVLDSVCCFLFLKKINLIGGI